MAGGILDGLNGAQREAVTHDAGPLLIVAGAGTGKTTVITRRIAYLIEQGKARPEEILALTFTDKAAAEMEARVDELVPYGYADVEIATFHAFGDALLRGHSLEIGLQNDFRVLSRAEQVIFLRDRLFDLPLQRYRPLGDPTRYLQSLITLFSRCKDEDISANAYLACAARLGADADDEEKLDRAEAQAELAATYARYQEMMARNDKIDFGDQVVQARRLLRARPHVLNAYQRRFKYVLVDEFQDTNYAQFELVKMLAARHGNVAVTGDDDQAIYRFRGAAISNVLSFLRHYPDARQIVVTENFRSHQAILDAAYTLIQYNNPDRLEVESGIVKRLTAVREAPGPLPLHWHYDTATQEADSVAQTIRERVEVGEWSYDDVAILVRSNDDADAFLRALNLRGVPWTFSGNAGLYGRPEVRLLLAFLRAVAHPDDSVSVHYLASSDLYQVPIVDLTRCATHADRKHRWLFDVLKDAEQIPELAGVLSVHKAKGLEFPVVFLVHLVQGKFPTQKRRDALELPTELLKDLLPKGDFHVQEERRLFYVGMTRARRELIFTSARDYGGARERKVSQFVLEALDLPRDAARPFKGKAVEEIERFAPPPAQDEAALPPIPADEEITISHKQVDDYQTCPLKYRYVHQLRVPILRHHSLVYGSTIHEVVEFYLKRRVEGNYTSLDDLLAEYDTKWVNQGFLTWEHQEARKAAGREALTRFWNQEETAGVKPTYIEKDFAFSLGPTRVRGRFDRVDEDLLGAVIVDYKTSEVTKQKEADRRVAASLQLKMYALAWRESSGRLPQRVELRFIESHVVGRHTPTEEDVHEALTSVEAAAAGIRARRFEATPSRNACRWCAYRQICPFTATRE